MRGLYVATGSLIASSIDKINALVSSTHGRQLLSRRG